MAINLSDEFLTSLLPDWYALLQGWAADGSLVAAAQEALLLEEVPEALEELANREVFRKIQKHHKTEPDCRNLFSNLDSFLRIWALRLNPLTKARARRVAKQRII